MRSEQADASYPALTIDEIIGLVDRPQDRFTLKAFWYQQDKWGVRFWGKYGPLQQQEFEKFSLLSNYIQGMIHDRG